MLRLEYSSQINVSHYGFCRQAYCSSVAVTNKSCCCGFRRRYRVVCAVQNDVFLNLHVYMHSFVSLSPALIHFNVNCCLSGEPGQTAGDAILQYAKTQKVNGLHTQASTHSHPLFLKFPWICISSTQTVTVTHHHITDSPLVLCFYLSLLI